MDIRLDIKYNKLMSLITTKKKSIYLFERKGIKSSQSIKINN